MKRARKIDCMIDRLPEDIWKIMSEYFMLDDLVSLRLTSCRFRDFTTSYLQNTKTICGLVYGNVCVNNAHSKKKEQGEKEEDTNGGGGGGEVEQEEEEEDEDEVEPDDDDEERKKKTQQKEEIKMGKKEKVDNVKRETNANWQTVILYATRLENVTIKSWGYLGNECDNYSCQQRSAATMVACIIRSCMTTVREIQVPLFTLDILCALAVCRQLTRYAPQLPAGMDVGDIDFNRVVLNTVQNCRRLLVLDLPDIEKQVLDRLFDDNDPHYDPRPPHPLVDLHIHNKAVPYLHHFQRYASTLHTLHVYDAPPLTVVDGKRIAILLSTLVHLNRFSWGGTIDDDAGPVLSDVVWRSSSLTELTLLSVPRLDGLRIEMPLLETFTASKIDPCIVPSVIAHSPCLKTLICKEPLESEWLSNDYMAMVDTEFTTMWKTRTADHHHHDTGDRDDDDDDDKVGKTKTKTKNKKRGITTLLIHSWSVSHKALFTIATHNHETLEQFDCEVRDGSLQTQVAICALVRNAPVLKSCTCRLARDELHAPFHPFAIPRMIRNQSLDTNDDDDDDDDAYGGDTESKQQPVVPKVTRPHLVYFNACVPFESLAQAVDTPNLTSLGCCRPHQFETMVRCLPSVTLIDMWCTRTEHKTSRQVCDVDPGLPDRSYAPTLTYLSMLECDVALPGILRWCTSLTTLVMRDANSLSGRYLLIASPWLTNLVTLTIKAPLEVYKNIVTHFPKLRFLDTSKDDNVTLESDMAVFIHQITPLVRDSLLVTFLTLDGIVIQTQLK